MHYNATYLVEGIIPQKIRTGTLNFEHSHDEDAFLECEKERIRISALLSCDPDEIIFIIFNEDKRSYISKNKYQPT